ncbi:MAG: glycosyltransferase, partial [Paracoccaceae bacterium]
AKAHVMINPRRPEGAFTRYSFPSKTMEYLASGRPVIMHWLPGMPEEYRPYLVTPETGDAEGLLGAMQHVAALPDAALRRIGNAGREFVLDRKSPKVQVGRMLAGLFS